MAKLKPDNQWDDVLSAASRLQGLVKEAVLVGGTASALFAAHRTSYDADHVIPNLREYFDEILENLESAAGWQTARIKRPVLILGSLNGIETGVRQLIRSAPLETMNVYAKGQKITVPTEAEILRIKGALILKRNATRDYLDFAALSRHLGEQATTNALKPFDKLYPQPNGQSPCQQLYMQLANPKPFDLEESRLKDYKNLSAEWHDWNEVIKQCRVVASGLLNTDEKNISDVVSIEEQAQETRYEQQHLTDASTLYDGQLKNFIQAKSGQADRLVTSLESKVASQSQRLQAVAAAKPNAISALWRGSQWREQYSHEQRRQQELENRLSRVKILQADMRRLERMAEAKLRWEHKDLTARRDAQLLEQRERLFKEKEKSQSAVQDMAQKRHGRGRTLRRDE